MQSSYKLHLCVGGVCVWEGGGESCQWCITKCYYNVLLLKYIHRIAGNLANIEFSKMAKNGYKFILAKFNDISAS